MNKLVLVSILLAAMASLLVAERDEEFFRDIMETQLQIMSGHEIPVAVEKAREHFSATELNPDNLRKYVQGLDSAEQHELMVSVIKYLSKMMYSLASLMNENSEKDMVNYGKWLRRLDNTDPDKVKLQPLLIAQLYNQVYQDEIMDEIDESYLD